MFRGLDLGVRAARKPGKDMQIAGGSGVFLDGRRIVSRIDESRYLFFPLHHGLGLRGSVSSPQTLSPKPRTLQKP